MNLMAAFMVPQYVKFVDRLPKTATERVQKFELRAEGIGSAWDAAKATGANELSPQPQTRAQ
jgi:crotonobetaine/carnitine-CoA ligase